MNPRKSAVEVKQTLKTAQLVSVAFSIVDPKKFTFECNLKIADANNVNTTYSLADQKGKVKTYRDIDAALKEVMSIVPSATTLTVEPLQTAPIVDALTGNPVSQAKREVARITKQQVAILDAEAKAVAEVVQVSSFLNGTSAQQAIYAEAAARRDSIIETKAALTARKAELETFIASQNG